MTAEQMAASDTAVIIARDDGKSRRLRSAQASCRRYRRGQAHVHAAARHRGRKIGAFIIERIEALAREDGLTRLVLETGDRHPAAWTVYERAGFIALWPGARLSRFEMVGVLREGAHSIFAPLALMMGPQRSLSALK